MTKATWDAHCEGAWGDAARDPEAGGKKATMIWPEHKPVSEGHPLRSIFRTLTERGLAQARIADSDFVPYLSDMLVRFVHIDSLYRLRDERGIPLRHLVDMAARAEESEPPKRGDAYRHLGDYALFVLGFYPESLAGRRKLVGPDYYAEQGRRSYTRAAEMYLGQPLAPVLRKLSHQFETCALGLHWVREYTHDPFYQYMLRQYGWM